MDISQLTTLTSPSARATDSQRARGGDNAPSSTFSDAMQRARQAEDARARPQASAAPANQGQKTGNRELATTPSDDRVQQETSDKTVAPQEIVKANTSDSQDALLDSRPAETSLSEDINALQQWLDGLPQNSPLKNLDAETLAKADDGSDLPAEALSALAALALSNSPQVASAAGKTPAISPEGSPARGANGVLATAQAMPTLLKETAQAGLDSEPFSRLDASPSGHQSRQEATTTPSLLDALAAKSLQDTATPKGASSLAAAVTEASAKLAGNTSQTTGDGAAFRDLIGGHAEQVPATPNSAPAVQPTALGLTATTATSTAAPGASIPVAVNSPQWPASFGQQILQMHQRGDQQVSLHLNPRDLGPLNVSLSVQDQQAQLQILSAHAPVRAAIEAAIPQLREALAQSGIALGEAMVGDQGQFQQQDQPGDQPRFAGSDGLGGGIGTSVGDETVTTRQIPLVDNGNINLYA